jgi:hypothetical protein
MILQGEKKTKTKKTKRKIESHCITISKNKTCHDIKGHMVRAFCI